MRFPEGNRAAPGVAWPGSTHGGLEEPYRLTDSPRHIVPGYDLLVMRRCPAASRDLEGIVVRLDVEPTE